ncbi:undecaprenyldiphospho-muramoylpentapeptide beta-N-acetylglucosaminyltransferase [Jiella sp. MQZ9-1]|uniref:UDP-N-acetylglucosamine--N-acetylmuramyl-(pentapeptide) pyrophosphoryl-undecaprenol N-acetylglucosamine transferase n=1 Tax=Jiella flava TaxID=2816857 RepID=A0A939FWG7_9HYPH|nr:undecaprenyldiphospho-muramoylpentapeptide beta-N-acetylglucosaminyltransferase [Jiella flava]MBO0662787.1 undecaprenyldiphospho-muramoylpentapeptide beta-N-acetylglucosaminyltransferase [Jiella flava]MCD2471208.1 undecaprenyldiphospho-muramoylpentapeptide beta-N-acetylglucosaminyltransferase [Jiella flava]
MTTILLAAGGTGGHLFPAEALAHELIARGFTVELVTDDRAGRFADRFPVGAVHHVRSATFGAKNPLAMAKTLWTLWRGFREAAALVRRLRPAVVVGFGGYPTVPPLMAATRAGRPTIIHEQNAVMGRANRFLASRVDRIAAGIPQDDVAPAFAGKIAVTGNPVRPAVLEAAKTPYRAPGAGEVFNLVVFGGSQGASFFSEALPKAIDALPAAIRRRLQVTQQTRREDEATVRAFYAERGVAADVSPFFTDMAARIGAAHLVVSRSGASTVSEIAVIGRPAILVPYPYALDHDQAANAAKLAAEGGAIVCAQKDLSPERLAGFIEAIAGDPSRAEAMATAAKATGVPNAAALLADLVASMPGAQDQD